RPRGRQCASGLSLLFSAARRWRSSAASGRKGRPPFTVVPMLKNWLSRGLNRWFGPRPVPVSGGGSGTCAAAPSTPGVLRNSQMPERSGLPSAVLGAGASRLTLPSAARGAPPDRWEGHCAGKYAGIAASTNAAAAGLIRIVILSIVLPTKPLWDNRP